MSFSWSFSKLKEFETCARRMHYEYLDPKTKKKFGDTTGQSEQQKWGDRVDAALTNACKTGDPLPAEFSIYQKYVDVLYNGPGELLVQQQWALNELLQPTTWFGHDAWLRVKADAVRIAGKKAVNVDWKTGKMKNGDPVQLRITALVMFAHFPELEEVKNVYVWLSENQLETEMVYRDQVADYWAEILPRAENLRVAVDTVHFPPKPGFLCANWCAVKSCEFNGRRF